ncbi:restriction endonuclease subunit S [Shewanella sp. 0m-4]
MISKQMKLGDIAEITMGQSPKGDSCNNDGQGMPLLNGPTEFGGVHPYPTQFTVDPKRKAKVGDILFCVRGSTTGRMNYADQEYAIGRGIGSIRGKNGYSTSFVRAVIDSNLNGLLKIATGTTFPNLGKDALNDYVVNVVDSDKSVFVGSLAQQIEEKVANNSNMNQTLEKLAQRIFKSWFIDFDPVKANKEGLPFDGLSPEIQALFPSEFEDSELGMIPKGWSAGKFEDLAVSIATGGTPKRSETSYWNEGIVPWLSSGEVKSGIATSTKECITELGLSKSAAKLWGKNTVVIAMYGATAGEVCLLGLAMTTNQACCGLTPHEHSRSYLFLAARNEKAKLVSKASGAAQQNLNKGLIASHPYVIPSDDILVNFEKVVIPLLEKWMDNEFQNRTLSSLRDRLLPKLISGQISVGEATQDLAEAV